MLALMDYFMKWVEVQTFHQVRDTEVKKFVSKNIICRFGVPHEIVIDNEPQFISFTFQDFCAEWNIKLTFANPRHPQSNGQAKSTNKTIVNTLRKRLENAKGKWADELAGVLWSYRITSKNSTGAMPFSIAFGTEVVVPVKISIPTIRSQFAVEEQNSAMMNFELDTIDEK